ncbi:MAG: hypothetical protein ABH951_02530, partial [Patescibacteria group bacterium]
MSFSKKFINFLLIFVVAFSFLGFSLNVEAATSGPNNGGTFTNDATIGTLAWTNPFNAQTLNGVYATAALTTGTTTQYLKATNFGFAIPAGSVINGIQVSITRDGAVGNKIKDSSLKLVKGGVIGGTDHSAGASWANGDTLVTYGSTSDLWGLTWTSADINSSNFGFVISATATGSRTATIDNINITVTYTSGNTAPNAPTLVSPASGSSTNDNTPTLSANYSDPDAGDVGTTNYRIATSAANCLAGTVVA